MNKENFVTIYSWMLTDLKLKGTEIIIFALIYSFSKQNQKFTGSINYLCRWTNSTKPTVSDALKSLQKKDLIVKEETFVNKVKYVKYYVKNFTTLVKKFAHPSKETLPPPSKETLPNNIVLDNIENNKEDKASASADIPKFDERGQQLNSAGLPIVDYGFTHREF